VLTAHAILCSAGFLVLLPLGALLAQYMRTLSVKWCIAHWVIQFGVSAAHSVLGSPPY
jgi:hypothetical protein